MKSYISAKYVKAEFCKEWKTNNGVSHDEPGYHIVYPDGYESWCPAEVFESSYLEVPTNTYKESPTVTQAMVDDFISSYEYTTIGNKTTVCIATLKNGFEITESSSCVSEENYDEDTGVQICMDKIKDKVWFLLGFLLQQSLGMNK